MNRLSSLGQSVLEALLVLGIGLGIPTLATTLLWGFHYQLTIEWPAFWLVAALAWLTGHGVHATIQLDAEWLQLLGLESSQPSFELSLAMLGFAFLTLYLARYAGRRIAHHPVPWFSFTVAMLVFAFASFAVVWSIPTEVATVSSVWGVILPTLWFVLPMNISMLLERPELLRHIGDVADRIGIRIPETARLLLRDSLTGGAIAVLAVLAVSGFVAAGLVIWNGLEMVSIYEALHAGYLGGSILTLVQIFLVPNFLIWTLSWFAGPGFSIGIATQVSPLGTQLGPLPALPVFGAIPSDLGGWGFLGFLVPLVAGFFVAMLVRNRDFSLGIRISLAGLQALVAAIFVFLLAVIASGSIGPGRMIQVGVDPVQVALWFGILVLIGTVIGTLSRYFSRHFNRTLTIG